MYDYADDLEPYDLAGKLKLHGAITIGWLEAGHRFEKGPSFPQFIEKLLRMMEGRSPYCIHSHKIRGVIPCKLCGKSTFPTVDPARKRLVGSTTLWVPRLAGGYYVSPSLIAHYICKHEYRPPNEFIDSVFIFDEAMPFKADEIYAELVKCASKI